MNQIEGVLLLISLPLAMIVSGYWLAALPDASARERLAFALLGGLSMLLAAVAAVNFFRPLSGIWAYACLVPALLSLVLPRARRQLGRDLFEVLRHTHAGVWLGLACYFLLLLWPLLRTPTAMFYDGTSNHDSFFWIADAEHLKRHTYMEPTPTIAEHPISFAGTAVVGWRPAWGRIGGEGLLALASSVIGLSPVKLYLYGTASLALAWIAASYLALRTFVTVELSRPTAAALVFLQPMFVFFFGNANLPNLLGIITGTAAMVATEQAARAGWERRTAFAAWAALAALSLHGVLCSYPEIVPFILLPCGLLWLRPWFSVGFARFRATGLALAAALLAGLLLNPATTIRGVNGFIAAVWEVRADNRWANLFDPLDVSEYVPGLISLSISAAKELDWLGWPLSLVLLGGFGLAAARSRDRFGLAAGLSGGAALLAYTVISGFVYGLQKTIQFSGIFVSLAFSSAIVETLVRLRSIGFLRRALANIALASVVAFLAFATVMNCRDLYKWSDRKVISSDWFDLRKYAAEHLRQEPVLVEAAAFRMAFFHGMWAAYFLPDSALYYGARGEESGGYLRSYVVNEAARLIPKPAAILVGRPWADSLDANSPRLVSGREYALLSRSNRVSRMSGLTPTNGPPEYASGSIGLELLPHADSVLVMELRPRSKAGWPAGEWRATRRAEGAPEFSGAFTGASPWILRIPLVGGRRNTVLITLAGTTVDPATLSFAVHGLRIENAP